MLYFRAPGIQPKQNGPNLTLYAALGLASVINFQMLDLNVRLCLQQSSVSITNFAHSFSNKKIITLILKVKVNMART